MTVNASLKVSEANGAIQDHRPIQAQCTIVAEKPAEGSSESLVPASHPDRVKGGTRFLVCGAWTLLVIQILAIVGYLIHGHVRDSSIDAFLLAPSSPSMAASFGILIGTTLPGITALTGGLSLCMRTNSRRGKGLSLLASLAVVAMVGLQLMPTFSIAGRGGLSTPSSRLVGHWRSDNDAFWTDVHYGPTDSVGMGTCYAVDGRVLFKFQILSEDRWGIRLVAREFLNRVALYDVEYCVSKDGRSMTKEYIFESGSRVLSEYRRVDGDSEKIQALQQHPMPIAPRTSASPQQNTSSSINDLYALLSGGKTIGVQYDTFIISDGAVINGFSIKYIGPKTVQVERNGIVRVYELNK